MISERTLFKMSEADWANDWEHSRANHLAYELLSKLAMEGPLKDKVLFKTKSPVAKNYVLRPMG